MKDLPDNFDIESPELRGEEQVNHRLMDAGSGEHELPQADQAPGNILVPLTLSAGSGAALVVAGNLARATKARLTLLHVVQLSIVGEERGVHRERLVRDLVQEAELKLKELASGLGGAVATEVLVCEGHPSAAILEAARRLSADTIVMVTHGQRRWTKWLHRNTAAAVVRQAACGVVLVSCARPGQVISLTLVDRTKANQPSGWSLNEITAWFPHHGVNLGRA